MQQAVDTDLAGVHVDLAGIGAAKAAKVGRAAQPVMQVFDLGGPVRLKRIFDARAGRPSTVPLTVREAQNVKFAVCPSGSGRSVEQRIAERHAEPTAQ